MVGLGSPYCTVLRGRYSCLWIFNGVLGGIGMKSHTSGYSLIEEVDLRNLAVMVRLASNV